MTLMSDLGGFAAGGTPDYKIERVARGVGVALGKCLHQALHSGRLHRGILASASLLQKCPERVLLCVLPVSSHNVSDHALHIHHTLLAAFCAEHSIRCLRVQGEDLCRVVTQLTQCPADGADSGCGPLCPVPVPSSDIKPDVSCVLVKSPKDGSLSFEDEVVLDYHDEMMNSAVFPKPVLNIPG